MEFDTVETEFDVAAELAAARNARALHVLDCMPDRWVGMSDAAIVAYCQGYQYGTEGSAP